MRAAVCCGAGARAAVMLAPVTVPLSTVLHCVVVQLAHPVGIPPGTPAFVQSTPLAGSKMPDHACPYETAEKSSSIEIRGKRCVSARLIYLWPPTTCSPAEFSEISP